MQTPHRHALPVEDRKALFKAFDQLPPGSILELHDETDPRPLRNELQHTRAGQFSWDAQNYGNGRWTVRLEKIEAQDSILGFLTHCRPFRSASTATMTTLAAAATERTYKPGDIIFDEGARWPYLAFIREGKTVLTLVSVDGKAQALGERQSQDSLNETATFDGGRTTTRAEALTDCTIVLLPCEAIVNAVRSDAALGLSFLAAASQARRRSVDTIADLSFAQTLQRVANFLLSYAPEAADMAKGLPGIEKSNQARLAAAAGTVRDVAARALWRLRDAAAVELERGRVTSIDRPRLESFATGIVAPNAYNKPSLQHKAASLVRAN